MCNEQVLVPIPYFMKNDPLCVASWVDFADSAEHGIDEQGRRCFKLDKCIVPALLALWDKGIKTSGCCCGHGSGSGVIGLITDYTHEPGMHLMEAPPYTLIEVVERRRHENRAYKRGVHDGLVRAGREDMTFDIPRDD